MSSRRESEYLRLEQRVKDAEHAQHQAEQAKQESEYARQEVEHARQEAEHARQEAEHARQEAEHAQHKAELRTQDTTFAEYLQACHEHLHKPMGVQTLEQRVKDAEHAQHQAEQAKQESEYARQEAEHARQEAEHAQHKAELRTQDTTFAEYLQACHEHLHKPMGVQTLEQRVKDAEHAQHQAEQAKQESEYARQEAEHARQEAEHAQHKAELRTQDTTFAEYLQACHEHLHKPMGVQTERKWTSKGGTTNPKNKYYPKTLRPWADFHQMQQATFLPAYSFYHPSEGMALRLFSPIFAVEDHGRKHCRIKIANEIGLRCYENIALEIPVTEVINHLCEIQQAQDLYQLKEGITFENDANSLSDTAEEVQQRLHLQPPQTPPSRRESSQSSNLDSNRHNDSDFDPGVDRTRADQYCVYKNTDGNRNLLLVVEYKPPHKLSIGNVRAGFREMDLKEDVIDRVDIPVYKEAQGKSTKENEEAREAKLQYNADLLVAAVATQTFHYMIENRLEYSYITTGEVFVFLRIKEKDPATLYYHVAVPTEEAATEGSGFLHSQTAIGQVMSLCLMAFQSNQRSHEWQMTAKKQLKKYQTDWQDILRRIPISERKQTPKTTSFKGRKGLRASHYNLRSWHGRGNPRDPPDGGHGGPATQGSPTMNKASRSKKKGGSATKSGGEGSSGKNKEVGVDNSSKQARINQGTPKRQYCTQKCLLGITRGSKLDKKCPNAPLHPARYDGKHTINRSKFLRLVRSQLGKDLDNDCEPLNLQGARGALFRITLASHGYVFVAKGTVKVFIPDILHEGKIYRQLERLQGTAIPVCLGNIDLEYKYYLDAGVRIKHMLLMSWGGETIYHIEEQGKAIKEDTPEFIRKETERTVVEVEDLGVDQDDVRPPNLLWNEEAQRIMLIDFERAVRIDDNGDDTVGKRVLQEVSPNKRRKGTHLRGVEDKAWIE